MKLGAALIAAALAGFSLGQISPAEQPIQSAFELLRQEPEILLQLDGVDQFGTKSTALFTNVFFAWNPASTNLSDAYAKTDLQEFLNGKPAKRICGDGTTLWAYDFRQNSYTSARYGTYTGPKPEGFRVDMLQNLTTSSQGPSIFLARMLREVFAGDTAQYRSWLPGAAVTIVSSTSGTSRMADPVVPSRVYLADPDNFFIVYSYAQRPERSAAFHFMRTAPGVWALQDVYYADKQWTSQSSARLVDWHVTVYTGNLPASTNYKFVPPSNARPIANVRNAGG